MHFEKITNFWCSDRGIIGRLSGLGGWPVDASQEPEIEPERAALRGRVPSRSRIGPLPVTCFSKRPKMECFGIYAYT